MMDHGTPMWSAQEQQQRALQRAFDIEVRRADAAEAEVERLRAALTEITELRGRGDRTPQAKRIAYSALRGALDEGEETR